MPHDQIDFAFVAELPTQPAPRKRHTPAGKRTRVPLSDSVPPPAEGLQNLELLAQQLEASPDYRVLRRLPARWDWPEVPGGGKLCRMLLLDTETTGLDHSRDKIIELALLRVDVDCASGLPVGRVQVYDGLEDPGLPIPKEVQGITGINDAMVQGKTLDADRIAEMLAGVDLVVAHNAGFDRPFVESRLPAFSNLAWACSFADIDWRAQGSSSAKLESLALELGYFYDAHRAEMDCHALLAVLARPLPNATHTALSHLMIRAEQGSYRLQATGAPFDAKDRLKARSYRWNGDQRVWHTRLPDAAALEVELAWLRDNIYRQRSATVQVEQLDARVRYSLRAGDIRWQVL